MIPIRLQWQRPRDGVEVYVDGGPEDQMPFRTRSDRTDSITYDISNLENPISLNLINCRQDQDFVRFVERFGLPRNASFPSTKQDSNLWEMAAIKEELEYIFELAALANSSEKALHANNIMKCVSLVPTFEFSAGKHHLAFQPTDLSGLMIMEAVVAFDVGAVLTRCDHCAKAYLTGPLTGRRSHSKYCSDRCRVAAMRARNKSEGREDL